MDKSDMVIGVIIAAVKVIAVVLSLYAFFVYIPVGMYTEAQCLRQGYPNYYVSVGLERYCANFDGAVTVKVDKSK